MTTDRTVALWESAYNLGKLSTNGFSYCIAKSVLDSTGALTYNMVWQSKHLSPRASVTWTVQYGLNWTLDIPVGNAQVTVGGIWQACDPGQVFDLDSNGLFQPSSVASKPAYLKIGKNGYHYDGTSGIHILVGVKTPEGEFEPIYVDTTELGLNMSSWYQPQEKAQWWYEKGVQSTTMITGAVSDVCDYDLTTPNSLTNTYYVSTTYDYDAGTWSTALVPPPQASLTGMMGADIVGAGDPNDDLNDNDLDKIRKDVKEIMDILNRISGDKLQGPGKEVFFGLLLFATAAACLHGVNTIVNKLIDKGYGATATIAVDKVSATVTITPPPRLQGLLTASGAIPPQVTTDWNAAVTADSADNPTNKGVSTTKS
ncbi:hypothetical protein MMC17_002137 [Xylographa soralifera]|nr:hypothetical protein [Xylographa soralifera]